MAGDESNYLDPHVGILVAPDLDRRCPFCGLDDADDPYIPFVVRRQVVLMCVSMSLTPKRTATSERVRPSRRTPLMPILLGNDMGESLNLIDEPETSAVNHF